MKNKNKLVIVGLFAILMLTLFKTNNVSAKYSVLNKNRNDSDIMEMSSIEILESKYNKREVDITFLAVGEEVGHNHVYETKYNAGTHWKQCIICDKIIDQETHTYSAAWTMGDSCSSQNKLIHSCDCGYSYQTENTRPHQDYHDVLPESNTYHTLRQCTVCRSVAGGSISEIHYDANGQLGCATGRAGTCSVCGRAVTADNHEGWLHPNVVANNNYSYHGGNEALCTKCKKSFVSDVVSTVSYNGTIMTYDMTVTYKYDISQARSFTANAGFYPSNTGNIISSSYTINGSNVTYHIIAEMIPNYEKSTVLFYNPSVITSDGTKFNLHQDTLVIAEKTPPTIGNISQRDITSSNGWTTAKQITISGTENYCAAVNITVKDEEGNIYLDNASALVNNNSYSYSFIPQIEADENGKKLIIIAKDSLGNTSSKDFMVYKIDNYTPTIVGDMTYVEPWSRYKDITFYAKDGGIKNVKIGFNSESDLELGDYVSGLYQREYRFVGDVYGQTVARVYAEDGIGNKKSEYVKIGNIDNTAPTITSFEKNLNVREEYATLDVKVNANDINTTLGKSGSGVSYYAITNSNTIPNESSEIWKTNNTFSISDNGTYYLWAKDLVGNISVPKQIIVTELETIYTVRHFLMNVDGINYTLKDSKEFVGRVRDEVTPSTNEYVGFSKPLLQTKRIKEDGTTVIDYYYTRNKYNVELTKDVGVNSVVGNKQYFYEADVTIDAILNDRYVWDKWTGFQEISDKTYSFKMPAQDLIYNACTLKQSDVISTYIDANSGEEIIPDVVVTYKEGDLYSTVERSFDGYRLVSKTNNTYGTVEREDIIVTYYYKKISAGVDVRYIDEMNGENIAGMIHMSGLEKDPYTTSSKNIPGYELVTIPENATGEMTVPKIDVTYGYKLISYVTVRCVDENTNRILYLSEPVKYLQGDTYRTTRREIDGYTYTRVDKAEEAQIGREDITVTYYYKKNTSVTVKYVDMLDNNKEIHASLPIPGLQGDNYTTKPIEIEGYRYIQSQGVVEGKMGSEPSTVVYKYKKLANLVTEHIDANTGEKITEDVTTTYKEGDTYEALAQNVAGYVVVEEPEEKTGIMGRDEIRKQYYYKKISKGLVVKYVDVKTNEVLDREIYEGNENDKVTLETKQFLHYVLHSKPDMDEILLTPEAKELVYYYRRTVEMDVVGIDVDTGEELYQTQISGREDDDYSTIAKLLDEYEMVGKDKAEGIFERSNTRIEFLYKKISEEKYSTIILKYVDKDTNKILKSETITAKVGDKYSTEKLDFAHYKFVRVSGLESGIVTEEPQEVTYYYTKKIGKVIISYEDENGNILKEEEITGKIEEEYKVNIEEIDGYKIVETPTNTQGKFTEDTIKVKVKLEKIPDPIKTGKVVLIYEDENGKILKREELVGNVGQNYKVKIEEIDGYELAGKPEETEGKYIDGTIEIKVKFKKIIVSPVVKGTIVVKYLDEEGNVIMEDTIEEGIIGDEFYIELPEIDGYKIIGNTFVKAKFIDGKLTFNATYEKTEESKEANIPDTGDINIIGLNIIIILSVIITKHILKCLKKE